MHFSFYFVELVEKAVKFFLSLYVIFGDARFFLFDTVLLIFCRQLLKGILNPKFGTHSGYMCLEFIIKYGHLVLGFVIIIDHHIKVIL